MFDHQFSNAQISNARYGAACTLCEFVTGLAYAMEASGGLDDVMSDRMDELVAPVRSARDWLWHVGQLMSHMRPLPSDFDDGLDRAEERALDALPKIKELVAEACEALASARAHAYEVERETVFA
ncbi:hypothetical protein DFR50_12527 [Roseiarcus fermentans]|uniref:Uncharacterized protein n=1 Tax=Roseiarcus fermentans TaxID=1473586 RepID=A0A366F4B1_9HYPH|nr:hypothetical protein [Roseiarcus fermentans]RBP08545.1 hypothetical protein DFR50_12527 [Roseiarcus fermentans]